MCFCSVAMSLMVNYSFVSIVKLSASMKTKCSFEIEHYSRNFSASAPTFLWFFIVISLFQAILHFTLHQNYLIHPLSHQIVCWQLCLCIPTQQLHRIPNQFQFPFVIFHDHFCVFSCFSICFSMTLSFCLSHSQYLCFVFIDFVIFCLNFVSFRLNFPMCHFVHCYFVRFCFEMTEAMKLCSESLKSPCSICKGFLCRCPNVAILHLNSILVKLIKHIYFRFWHISLMKVHQFILVDY